MLFDAFEVAALIAVVRGGRVPLSVRDVRVEVVNGRRNPDGRDAEARKV